MACVSGDHVEEVKGNDERAPRFSRAGIVVSVVFLVAVIAFVAGHLGEARHFVELVERARPLWLLAGLGLQVLTYVCAGAAWSVVASSPERKLPVLHLARLAIEKLSVDQFMPSGGVAGHIIVGRAMRRLGLPDGLVVDALLINVIAFYAAYACATAVALTILWLHHKVTALVLVPVAIFGLIAIGVPLGIRWVVNHPGWVPGQLLGRFAFVRNLRSAISGVSPERVFDRRLLARATALRFAIFVLDSATLWTMLTALDAPLNPLTAFAALVMASIAGTLSFLPGGVGSFEAGCTATLTLLGAPVEAALTGTLLLRGLTLWLPLIPGLILVRQDLAPQERR